MTAVICLGGPLHGQFVDPGDADHVHAEMRGRRVTYHLRSIEIVGWRLVLNCLTTWDAFATVPDGCVLPGYVHEVPADCEADRNAPEPVCACPLVSLANSLRQVTNRGRSSCHLDHCPVHGPFRTRGKTNAHGG